MTDPIADLLSRVRNGYMTHKIMVSVPHSKFKEGVARILKEYQFIEDVKVETGGDKSKMHIYLRYHDKQKAAIEGIRRVSKPSRRVYHTSQKMPRVRGGFGIAIVSTPQGVMAAHEAQEKGLGGEIICEVW